MKKLFITLFLFTYFALFANEIKHNINANKLSIKEFIQISSKILDKYVLIPEDIKGEVNFISHKKLSKDEIYKLLEFTLQNKGYSIQIDGNLLRIVNLKSINKVPNEQIIKIVALQNADAKNVALVIQGLFGNNNIVKVPEVPFPPTNPPNNTSITVDTHTNSLIIKATKEKFEQIDKLIKELDAHQMQVYVEAKIIELSENRSKEIGVKWGLSSVDISGNNIFSLGANLGGSVNALDFSTNSLFSLSPTTLTSAVALGATLSLLKDNQVIDIVSEPSILSLNNKTSTIYVGETRSFQTSEVITDGGNTNSTFQREDIGLTLKVKPRISTQNRVILELEAILEDAKEQRLEQVNPDTTKKEIKTTAIVSNAQSVILGGLIKNKFDQYNSQVPLLGDIPLLGEAFKYKKGVQDKTNLVVIVTPYIIPKSKDFESIKEQLAKLKILESEYIKRVKKRLEQKTKEKETKTENKKENKKQKDSNKIDHLELLNSRYGG